jgi:hypothetical protein
VFLQIPWVLNVMFIICRVVYWILRVCFDNIVWVSCELFVRNPAVSPKVSTIRGSAVQRIGDSYRRVAGSREITRVLLLLRDRRRPWALNLCSISILELLVVPQRGMAYVQTGFRLVLYISNVRG